MNADAAQVPTAQDELADRATRVRAMLARWNALDALDEPEWDVDALTSLELRVPVEAGTSATSR